MSTKQAVLMLAYGTPSSPEDLPAYLLDVREGRAPSPALVDEMRHRYALIGKSPLTELTLAQAKAVEEEFTRRDQPRNVYVGMRHWNPRIHEAVQQMKADGVDSAVAIVMAPHYSSLSIGRYQKRVEEAQQEAGSHMRIPFVHSWWEQPKFFQAILGNVKAALKKFPPGEKLKFIFSAHSLPARILQMGDPYDRQLRDNAGVLAERLGKIDWMFAYQSAGATAEPWLGPALEDVLPGLRAEGYRHVLVVPIGFVCDHVEILYDLDIEARAIAEKLGLHLERTESLNTSKLFIGAVADAILQQEAAAPS